MDLVDLVDLVALEEVDFEEASMVGAEEGSEVASKTEEAMGEEEVVLAIKEAEGSQAEVVMVVEEEEIAMVMLLQTPRPVLVAEEASAEEVTVALVHQTAMALERHLVGTIREVAVAHIMTEMAVALVVVAIWSR